MPQAIQTTKIVSDVKTQETEMITRPWPSSGVGWLLATVALIFEILIFCGVPVPHGMMIPLTLTTVALLV